MYPTHTDRNRLRAQRLVMASLRRLRVSAGAVLWLWSMAAGPARGDNPYAAAASPASGDTADVYETTRYPALQAPQYLWNTLTYPLGQFVIYAEHEELHLQFRDFFTSADHTFGIYPLVQVGGETRSGSGARLFDLDLFGRDEELEVVYVFSHPDRQLAEAHYRDPSLLGRALYSQIDANWLRTDNHNSTANGSLVDETTQERLTGESDLARFAIERSDITSLVGWRSDAGPLEGYRAAWIAEAWVGASWRNLTDLYPAASRDFLLDLDKTTPTAAQVPGLGSSVTFARLGARVLLDDRDHKPPTASISHPMNYLFPGRVLIHHEGLYHSFRDIYYAERGSLLQAEVEYARGSDQVRYLRLGAEVQRFWTLFWSNRVIGLRGRLDKVHGLDGGMAPFSDLPTLGGSQRLRGYERGNFRGEGAVLVAAEYRYPVWDTWNAYLFYEEGQVFDGYGDIELGEFHSCYGAGLSLRTEQAFLIGLRVAHSAQEKALVGFTLEQEF